MDLYVIEFPSKFELISLPVVILQNMHKVVHVNKEKNGMPYGYFLNRVFDHFGVVGE